MVIDLSAVKVNLNGGNCPVCGSEDTKVINVSYPRAYECKSCNHMFAKFPQSLIDE